MRCSWYLCMRLRVFWLWLQCLADLPVVRDPLSCRALHCSAMIAQLAQHAADDLTCCASGCSVVILAACFKLNRLLPACYNISGELMQSNNSRDWMASQSYAL